jgi:chromosome segregation ATPase
MWPRLLAQLFELLPHVSRLVPLADRYFAMRSASERAQEAALATLAETVHGDVAGLTQSNTRLAAQLEAQTAQLARVTEDLNLTRRELSAQTAQLEAITRQLKRLGIWIMASSVLVLLLFLGALIFLLLLHDGMTHPG